MNFGIGALVEIEPRSAYLGVVRDFACSCYLPTGGRSQDNAEFGPNAVAMNVRQSAPVGAFQRRPDMAQGTVKFFNSQKGFGFIQPDDGGKDVFVHISAVERAGMSSLNEGQKLSYDVVSERGKLAAANLQNV
jgi:CspA family cold shock protein